MFRVKIPYAERIRFHDNRDSRNTSMFLDMIKGYARFYHMQRESDKKTMYKYPGRDNKSSR
jgi:hypothetical protein